jgi:hypothetical protein
MPVTTINWKKELSNPLILMSEISAMYMGDATQKRPPQNPVISRPTISISTAAGTIMNTQPVLEQSNEHLSGGGDRELFGLFTNNERKRHSEHGVFAADQINEESGGQAGERRPHGGD